MRAAAGGPSQRSADPHERAEATQRTHRAPRAHGEPVRAQAPTRAATAGVKGSVLASSASTASTPTKCHHFSNTHTMRAARCSRGGELLSAPQQDFSSHLAAFHTHIRIVAVEKLARVMARVGMIAIALKSSRRNTGYATWVADCCSAQRLVHIAAPAVGVRSFDCVCVARRSIRIRPTTQLQKVQRLLLYLLLLRLKVRLRYCASTIRLMMDCRFARPILLDL